MKSMPQLPFHRTLDRAHRYLARTIYGQGKPATVSKLSDGAPELTPMAVHAPDLREGNPQMRSAALNESPDRGMATGLWDCTAGRFRWVFQCDEVVHILEGEVIVTVGDQVHHLRAGDVAFFPIGTDSDWKVNNYVKKIYFHRHPTPLLNSIMRS
jgi:uncharacterized cupin superfamily protein